MELEHDPLTLAAIARAAKAHRAATGQWVDGDNDSDSDSDSEPAAEAEALARDALAHLNGGRWDEARACAEAAAALAEDAGEDAVWREFSLLVEEAAETGGGQARAATT